MNRFLQDDPMLDVGEVVLADAYAIRNSTADLHIDWYPATVVEKLDDGTYTVETMTKRPQVFNLKHWFYRRPETPDDWEIVNTAKVQAVKALLKGE